MVAFQEAESGPNGSVSTESRVSEAELESISIDFPQRVYLVATETRRAQKSRGHSAKSAYAELGRDDTVSTSL